MNNRELYRRLLVYLRPYVWPHFVCAMVCMVLFSATNGVMPFLVQATFSEVFEKKKVEYLYLVPAGIVGVFLLRGLVGYGSVYFTEYVGQKIIQDLRKALNDHIQRLPLSYFNHTSTAALISRVSNDVAVVRGALTETVAAVLKDATSLIFLLATAFIMDWFMALIAFVVFPLAVYPVIRLSKRVKRTSTKGQVSISNLTVLLQETIQGNRVVKAFGMEDYERRRFDKENEHLFALSMKATSTRALTNPIMEVLASLGIAAVLVYGGYQVIHGGREQGAFFGFLTAVLLLYEPFKALARTNTAAQQGLAAAVRVFEVLDTSTEVIEMPNARVLREMRQEIAFDKVDFRYDHELVLQDIDIRVGRGQVIALVGPSGAGKSTIADLIPRFYDVAAGRITIDGVDLREFTLASLRGQIAVVTQHTFLFNDTVRNNIAYGGRERDMDAIVAAARAARAHDFILQLPLGYETVVGEMGVMLSGGERQRLAIARALLKNAPILLLDEATSALDNESERLVQAALEALMVNRTTLVIAHRLSTVRRADRIYVISRGRVVEQGTHDELLALNAEYRRLYDMQFQDAPEPPREKMLH
jgi:ATP-binding cassette, subfamily B, bacterial MsbA